MDRLIIGIREENMQPANPSDNFLPLVPQEASYISDLEEKIENKIIDVFLIIDPNLSVLAFQIHSDIPFKLLFHLDLRGKYVSIYLYICKYLVL